MSSETARRVARRNPVRWLGRSLFLLGAGSGLLFPGTAPSIEAQQGGLLRPPGGVVAGAKTVRALVLDQVKRVPSGKGRDEPPVATRQLLLVDLDGQRLYMAEYDRDERGAEFLKQHIQVRLDGSNPSVYTLTADGRHYKEHSGDLNTLQHERNIAESNEVALGKRLSTREREAFFKENCHLRPDGRREIDFSLTNGETILGRACERLVVKENCLTIIDAQVTDAVPGARNYYHLYRRLGAFSEEVLEKLRDLDVVPLRAKINVVTALRTFPLEVETKRMEVREVPVAFFELPPNAEEIHEEEVSGKCPRCGKEFDPEVGVPYVDPQNRKMWFCSDECAVQYALEPAKKKGGKSPVKKTPAGTR